MKGGIYVVLTALLVYVAALGCAAWPRGQDAATAAPTAGEVDPIRAVTAASYSGLPLRGMVLQVQRIDSPVVYQKAIDEIAGLGADTIELVVDSHQELVNSDLIYIDVRGAPTIEKLTSLIQYAKSRGLRVLLMPILLLDRPGSNDWRGVIKPESWDDWWVEYRRMVTHYAVAAEAGHADVFMVGSELVSTETYRDQWLHTIHDVRQMYHGLLSYSANWDHYRPVTFWDHLDLICTNSYYKLGENKDVKVEEIVRRWQAIQKDFFPWLHKQKKPYVFTEVGWCSLSNAAHEPWDYTQEAVPIDLDLQKKLYEGFFQAWYGKPELGGYMIWQWTPNAGGPDDRGYTPQGKPAEAVLRNWLAKPRWNVNTYQ